MPRYSKKDFSEHDGVEKLAIFLRTSKKIFTHFSENDKRPIYDGDFDLLDNKFGKIQKTFRSQIKSYCSTHKTISIPFKYIEAVVLSISFDPFYYFVIFKSDSSSPLFYYLNLNELNSEIIYDAYLKQIDLKISIKDFKKLDNIEDFVDELDAFKKVLSPKDLKDSEWRALKTGCSYLTSSISELPAIKERFFPNTYKFCVNYAKNVVEGTEGLYSNPHNTIAIYPNSSKFGKEIDNVSSKTNYNFISRRFHNNDFDIGVFYDYLTHILDKSFNSFDNFFDLLPKILLSEIIFAALDYEYHKTFNKTFDDYISKEEIVLQDLLNLKFSVENPFKNLFNHSFCELSKRGEFTVRRLWHYRKNKNEFVGSTVYEQYRPDIFEKELDFYFSALPKLVEQVSNLFFSKQIKINDSWSYELMIFDNDYKDINIKFIKMNTFYKKGSNLPIEFSVYYFENFKSFCPLYYSVINWIKKIACDKFSCEFRKITTIDDVEIKLPSL